MIHASDNLREFFPAGERVSVLDGRLNYLVCDAAQLAAYAAPMPFPCHAVSLRVFPV